MTSNLGIHGKACAKINFFLHVNSKRQDGYHNISTLFIPINLFDEITLQFSDTTTLFCNDKSIPTDKNNIILKTDAILRQTYGLKDNFAINLKKLIPHGAGLGGGSSDAACYLRMVNEFSSLGLNYSDMKDIMSVVGSDTVFFIKSQPSLGYGRGNILEPIKNLPNMFFILINPNILVSTKKVYENKNLLLTDDCVNHSVENNISFENIVNVMKNDLEIPVFKLYPEIEKLVSDIKEKTRGQALMSGSGATVFAVYDNACKRDEMFSDFKKKYTNYFMCKAEALHNI